MERLEKDKNAAVECYGLAIASTEQNVIEVDQEQASLFRAELQALVKELGEADHSGRIAQNPGSVPRRFARVSTIARMSRSGNCGRKWARPYRRSKSLPGTARRVATIRKGTEASAKEPGGRGFQRPV